MLAIVLVFTFNALLAIMQFVADEDTLQRVVFWTMGSLVRASWEKLGVLAVVFIAMLFWSLRSAWQLTALRLGEERAMSFGGMFAVYACCHCCVSVCYQRWRWLSSGRLQVVLDGVIAV